MNFYFTFTKNPGLSNEVLLYKKGSPFGPVVGAIILTLLPEVLRPLHDFRLVFNGLIIVIAVLFMPHGLVPWRIRRSGARA